MSDKQQILKRKRGVPVVEQRIDRLREQRMMAGRDHDVFKSPLSDFQREIATAGLAERVHYLSHGQSYRFEAPPWKAAA